MDKVKKTEGINESDLYQSSLKYEDHIRSMLQAGKQKPLGEGVLIWDETKVIMDLLVVITTCIFIHVIGSIKYNMEFPRLVYKGFCDLI